MQEFIENIKSKNDDIKILFSDKRFIFFLLIFTLLTILLSYFIYNKYILPEIKKNHVLNKEFTIKGNENSKDILIIYFKTEWCPYCKKARPEWDKFVEYVNNINTSETYDFEIITSVVDCDKQTSIADKYEIEGYPTIKLIKNKEIYEYDAKPNKEHLIEFLKSYIE
tara:strand:+ start:1853 stop:2353 length:501 start_codon:yes stop_codon:yes gene_type:complete